MLPDPGCYEERYRLAAGAAAGLATGLVTIGLIFLTVAPWVTGVVIAVALLALTGPAVAARRMIAFRADHAGITIGAVPGKLIVRRGPAAFISWDIESAGVPRDLFCPSQTHTIYVERLVERARRPGGAFIPHRPDQRAPQVGDLICASRNGSGTTLDNLNRGAGHCDLVVEVRPGSVAAIGGNVGDSVSRSVFPLDANGFLSPISGRPFFTVIENRLQ